MKPRQRPYFGAYIEDLYHGIGSADMGVVEATPLKTGAMYPSLPMRVTRVLEGTMQEGEIFYLCDHQSEEPAILESGKTYVMQLSMFGTAHGPNVQAGEQTMEYLLSSGIASTQYTIDMESVYDPVTEEDRWYDEVTDGFYETERGKRWLALSSYQDYSMRTIPVQPTDGTKLLMYFYNGEAQITEGRDITEEEYEDGAKVCLIPEMLAMRLGKKVGDTLALPLYYADYSRAVGDAFMLGTRSHVSVNLLNAEGEIYQIFNEQEYEIVGLYTAEDKGSGSYSAGEYEVVIPWNAVPENCWEDNIAGAGPMKGADTSFQILNGTVEEFRERMERTLEKCPYIVAVRDGRIIGYAYASAFAERAAYGWSVELSIYVDMEERRSGAGRKLYDALETILKEMHILNVNACIACPKEEDEYLDRNSVQFHEHMGFRLAGEFHDSGYKFGCWYNMVWMEKMIGEHTDQPLPVLTFSQVKDKVTGRILAE